jgi:phage FluMu protein Com
MEALDGNAIGGLMTEIFGVEMTTATGVCAHCGAVTVMAEAVVYLEAPGAVARCRTCDSVLMVVVDVRGTMCVDLRGLARMDPAA